MDAAVLSDEVMADLAAMGAAGSNQRLFERRNTYLSMTYGSADFNRLRLDLTQLHPFENRNPQKDDGSDELIFSRIYTGRIFEREGPFKGHPCWIIEKPAGAPRVRRYIADRMGIKPAYVVKEAREYDEDEFIASGHTFWARPRCDNALCVRPGHIIITNGPRKLKDDERQPVMPYKLPEGVTPAALETLDVQKWIIERL